MRLAEQLSAINGTGAERRRQSAELVTAFLTDAWGTILPGASLGLVGSFARGAGGPRSDLDVVVLLPEPVGNGAGEIEAFIQGLWDTGLGVDHSVRTPAECADIAAKDLPALTGLLNLRHVAGDPTLTAQVSALVLEGFRKAARRKVGELLADAEQRWERFDQLDRLNEPDLKNSAGGLRDVDLLRALETSWLTDFPHREVPAAEATLMDIRDALQQMTGRHSTKLLRVYQPEVADLLGYSDETALMRALREAAGVIEVANQRAGAAARSSQKAWGPMGLARRIMRPSQGRRVPATPGAERIVDEYLLESGGELGFRRPSLAKDPDRVLDLAVVSAGEGLPISAATLGDIAPGEVAFEWTPARLERFVALLGSGAGLRSTWRQLDQVGLPAWWIPEWEPLRGRPQSASFHQWTVDRHLIETVVRMQEQLDGSLPERVALLSALLHDIGKQPPDGGTNHAVHGRILVEPILARMPMGAAERTNIADLVQHHLLLAQLATEADPEDPATVASLVRACGGLVQQVALLAALTRADSLGAGPKAWTPWRAALIEGLEKRAILSLER